jgi:hypothetical protein
VKGGTAYDPGMRNSPCHGQQAVNDGNTTEMEARRARQRHKHKLGRRQGDYCAARLIDTAESGAALKGTRHQCNSDIDYLHVWIRFSRDIGGIHTNTSKGDNMTMTKKWRRKRGPWITPSLSADHGQEAIGATESCRRRMQLPSGCTM